MLIPEDLEVGSQPSVLNFLNCHVPVHTMHFMALHLAGVDCPGSDVEQIDSAFAHSEHS